jgi:DNA-directed RNA polymerase specialized sigma24 family protein
MDRAFELLCALRAAPDRAALDRFLAAIGERLLALAQRFSDPEEIAQRTRIYVSRQWPSCRADSPGRLASWLGRLVRSQGIRAARLRPHPALEAPPPPPAPDEEASNRARGQAFEAAVGTAPEILLAELPARHRAWARAHDVAASQEGIRRDVEIALMTRRDGLSHVEVATRLEISLSTAKKASSRGAAAIALAARLLAEQEPDPWVREALLEIASMLDRG